MSLENNEVVGQVDMVTSHREIIEQNLVNKQFDTVTSWQVDTMTWGQRKSLQVKMIADIYISISTGTFDIENIKYEKKWQQLDLDTNFEP